MAWCDKNINIIIEAEKIINTHNYEICKLCEQASAGKRNCKEYCLPVEMFVELIEGNGDINNVKYLFKDNR